MYVLYIYSLKLPVWSTNHPTKKKRDSEHNILTSVNIDCRSRTYVCAKVQLLSTQTQNVYFSKCS